MTNTDKKVQDLIDAGLGVPPEYFGKDEQDYYKNLIEESDLIEASKPDGSPEEELFHQIQEDEREEWSDKKKLKRKK